MSASAHIELPFVSGGLTCSGTLFLPEAERPPVIMMAHGLGAECSFGLQPYVDRFVGAGYAVYLFDYRNFGGSEGAPRNLIDPRRHVADWKAALAFIRERSEIDTARIGLWGTSFSGGHALMTAAADSANPQPNGKAVKAVAVQVPFVDGLATTLSFSPGFMVQAVGNGMLDAVRSVLGLKPHTVPICSKTDSFGLMNTPESWDGYLALVETKPGNSMWKNEAPARITLTLPLYRPIRHVSRIAVPVQVTYALKDSLIPYRAVEKTIRKIPKAEPVKLPVGHFDLYVGEWFEKTVAGQVDFWRRTL